MANLDITIRRKNGATYDVLYPTTIISQVEGLQDALDAKIPLTQKGAANGVATLDSSGLIPSSQLGAYIRGGVKMQGTMGGASFDTVGELLSQAEGIVSGSNGAISREELVGYAWIASQYFTIVEGTLPANTAFIINPGDEDDSSLPIDVETGDILMISNYSLVSGTTHTYTLSFINNTYGMATASSPGIVALSESTSTATTGTDVITDTILAGLVTTTVGTANKLMAAAHNHDSTYLGINSNAVSASKWATARTVTFATGDVTGSFSIDGSANVGNIALTVADDSHNHIISNVDGLQTALDAKLDQSDLTNRPEIFYNTTGNSDGDLILDLDSDGAIA